PELYTLSLHDALPISASITDRALLVLDRLLHVYHHRPLSRLRELALARAERWIVDRQEADGSWGGIQPPWVYSLMALHLRGYNRSEEHTSELQSPCNL